MTKLNGKQYKLKDNQTSQDIASQRVQEDAKNTQGRHRPHRVGTLTAPSETFFLTFHELWEPMDERIVEVIRKTIVIDEKKRLNSKELLELEYFKFYKTHSDEFGVNVENYLAKVCARLK